MNTGNNVNQINAKMTLKDYYNEMEEESRLKFRRKVEDRTGCGRTTFYRWVSGKYLPSLSEQKDIGRIAKKPISELFIESK